MERAEEARLIARAIAGDRSAAQSLCLAHEGALFGFLLRLSGNAEVARDVTQDAFVRVLTNIERFDSRYRFSTWLFTIARRRWINVSQKMRPHFDTDTVGAAGDPHAGPERATDAADEAELHGAVLQSALLSLSLDQREVVLLYHQQDWPIARIAEYKRMPEGTIKSHLHRGRVKLREAVARFESLRRRQGVDGRGGALDQGSAASARLTSTRGGAR